MGLNVVALVSKMDASTGLILAASNVKGTSALNTYSEEVHNINDNITIGIIYFHKVGAPEPELWTRL